MSMLEESWQPIADTLGFTTEEEMLMHLYVEQSFSVRDISAVVGYSAFSVRARLKRAGAPMKGRGGPNNFGKRKYLNLTDKELFQTTVGALLTKYGGHASTIFAERRLRKNERRKLPVGMADNNIRETQLVSESNLEKEGKVD